MTAMKPDLSDMSDDFPKEIPIFPLADSLLFPGGLMPLHIFEPRYRTMVQDALAGDKLIGSALLESCGAEEYEQAPPFHGTVCVGYVLRHDPLPDGRSNIVLLGLSAADAESTDGGRPYRTARVELLPDEVDLGADGLDRIEQAFELQPNVVADLEGFKEQMATIVAPDEMPQALLGMCSVVAPLMPFDKLRLLQERSLTRRLEQLLLFLKRPWQWN